MSEEGRRGAFELLDQNNLGLIRAENLRAVAKEIGYPLAESDIKNILRTAANSRNEINYDDFSKVFSVTSN